MDFLCVLDQPFQQRWRRVAEEFTEFREDELGVRPEGRRPALWRKHDLIISVLGDQIHQIRAH